MTKDVPPGRGPLDAVSARIIQESWQQQDSRAVVYENVTMKKNQMVPSPYYRELLSLASALVADGRYAFRYELAVIVAQTACEILVEQTIASRVKGLNPQQTFNLHNKKTRKLYKSATADDIEKVHFWPQYGPHAIRRHEAVHRGRRVGPAEAQESLAVATQFVDHVEKVRQGLR
jgi:hypothetical protein